MPNKISKYRTDDFKSVGIYLEIWNQTINFKTHLYVF